MHGVLGVKASIEKRKSAQRPFGDKKEEAIEPVLYCMRCGACYPKYARFCQKCGEQILSFEGDKAGLAVAEPSPEQNPVTSCHSEAFKEQRPNELHSGPFPETPSDSPIVDRRQYGGLFERLLAYACDLTIIYLVLFALELSWGFLERLGLTHITITEDEWYLLFFPILFCYMILSLLLTRTTIGKAILGLGIEPVMQDGGIRRPSLGRLVLRETVGRMLSPYSSVLDIGVCLRAPTGKPGATKLDVALCGGGESVR